MASVCIIYQQIKFPIMRLNYVTGAMYVVSKYWICIVGWMESNPG
jgi:hypothetical protein